MLNSISYLEIRCRYNKPDLMLFSGAMSDQTAQRIFIYRNRQYSLRYDVNTGHFYIYNKHDNCIAVIDEDSFGFYIADAPEIGLNLVWGLLAQLNIYPVTSL